MPLVNHLNNSYGRSIIYGSFSGSDIKELESGTPVYDIHIPITIGLTTATKPLVFVVGKLAEHDERTSPGDDAYLFSFDNAYATSIPRLCIPAMPDKGIALPETWEKNDAFIFRSDSRTRIHTVRLVFSRVIENVYKNAEYRYLIADIKSMRSIDNTKDFEPLNDISSYSHNVANRLYEGGGMPSLEKIGTAATGVSRTETSTTGTIGLTQPIYNYEFDRDNSILLMSVDEIFRAKHYEDMSDYLYSGGIIVKWPGWIKTVSENSGLFWIPSRIYASRTGVFVTSPIYLLNNEATRLIYTTGTANSGFVEVDLKHTYRPYVSEDEQEDEFYGNITINTAKALRTYVFPMHPNMWDGGTNS